MLCTASYTFRIIVAYSALCFFRYTLAYSIIFSFIQAYPLILRHCKDISRLIRAYSAPFVILAYSHSCHILNPGIFRTGSLFKALWNVDQTYSELCHRASFSHIQAYSEPCATLAYTETWHIRNPGMFRTLP